MGSMYLRTLGKFFIICLRLINAANIAKYLVLEALERAFRTIVYQKAKNLCVFIVSYRRLISFQKGIYKKDCVHGKSMLISPANRPKKAFKMGEIISYRPLDGAFL